MARFTEIDTSSIYEIGSRFLEHCLQSDGSLIHKDMSVWSLDNLERLRKTFTESPDTGDRTFTDKFADQIRPAGKDISRLAAEVLAVYFLFPSNVGVVRKKDLVGQVLGWAEEELPSDCLIAKAFAQGIGSAGQGYNTRRPFEIAFLIEFSIAWKRLTEDERAATAIDPWKFMEMVDFTRFGRQISTSKLQ